MKRSKLTASAGAFFALLVFSTGAPAAPGAKSAGTLEFGGRSEKRPPGPTEITAREAIFDNRTQEATFTGQVVVKDPEFGIACEKLAVYLKGPAEIPIGAGAAADPKVKREGEGGNHIDKAIAEVDVVITMDKPDAAGKPQRYIGRAKKAVIDNTKGILTLSGWPQIAQGVGDSLSKHIISREESCVIIIDRAGKIEVKGYHTTSFTEVGAAEPAPRRP